MVVPPGARRRGEHGSLSPRIGLCDWSCPARASDGRRAWPRAGARRRLAGKCKKSRRERGFFRRIVDAKSSHDETLSRDNLLFAPASPSGGRSAVYSLADFIEFHSSGGSSDRLDLTRSRCIFTAGDPRVESRFRRARSEVLAGRALQHSLAEMLSERSASRPQPGSLSFDDIPGGLSDVEFAARVLQVAHPTLAGENEAPTAASVFRIACEQRLIAEEACHHLALAAETWRSIKGILELLLEPGVPAESAPELVKAVVARSCGADDFDSLTTHCSQTAVRAAAEIGSLDVVVRPSAQ